MNVQTSIVEYFLIHSLFPVATTLKKLFYVFDQIPNGVILPVDSVKKSGVT